MRTRALLPILIAACGGAHGNSDGPAGQDSGTPTADAPPAIAPDDPGPADVRVTIDSTLDVHPISPFIYGSNFPDWARDAALYTVSRSGGNRLTAYNWENNASNAGTDYFNQNDALLGSSDAPGKAQIDPIAAAHAHGAAHIVTVPILGYVAADKAPGGDVNQTPNYLQTRFKVSKSTKGAPLSATPDPGDANVYQDEFVAFVESRFPGARTDARRTVFYDLDNEPDLWSATHPRIHPDPVTYDELIAKDIEYGDAIKRVAPQAKVFGFVSYGWNGYVTLQDAPDRAGRDFIDTWLAAIAARGVQIGTRPVDVLDLHWYPEATGGGQRITVDAAGAAIAAARVQAPRSLWDPTYTEASWITQFSTSGPIALIPRIRDKVARRAPGMQLSISEYYYGGGADISGAVAQADVLGVFGREGLFAATLWHLGTTDDAFIKAGFAMYRVAGGGFGDTSIHADSDHIDQVAVYASLDHGVWDRVIVVLINRSTLARTTGLRLTHGVRFARAELWRLTSASSTPARGSDIAITRTNALVVPLPAMSVTTLVLHPS